MTTYTLYAPSGSTVGGFEAKSGNQYTVTNGSVAGVVPNDLPDFLHAGFTLSSGSGSGASYPLTPSQQAQSGISPAILFPKYSAKLSKAAVGASGPCRVALIGDSGGAGAYSNNSSSGDWRAGSWTATLAKMFQAAGINATSDAFFGFNIEANDGRLTYGSSWTVDPTSSFGGGMMKGANSSNALVFTPVKNVDTFVIWYATAVGVGIFSYSVNGGAATNVNANAAYSLSKVVVPATLGANYLSISQVSGGNVFIAGIEAYDSTQKQVVFINAGWSGASTVSWLGASVAYSPFNAIPTVAADLYLICLTSNDADPRNAISPATHLANTQSLITQAKTAGDVMLVSGYPQDITIMAPLATQALYTQNYYTLAANNNLALVDVFNIFQSYEISNPLGLYYGSVGQFPQNLHMVAAGYRKTAKAVFNVISNV